MRVRKSQLRFIQILQEILDPRNNRLIEALEKAENLEGILGRIEQRLRKLEECCGEQTKLTKETKQSLNLLVAPRAKRKGLEYLKQLLINKQHIAIVDPYLLKLDNDQIQPLLELIGGKSRIDIYTKRNSGTGNVLKRLKEESGAAIYIAYVGKEVHDRVWFWFEEENSEPQGVVFGTSFNGLGKHLTFVLNMPEEDAREFWKHLSRSYRPKEV
ncbi:hypothetical protein [Calidithermus timidus]|uniref:hypothetical protein n=1 Tax=Calidithermus timidus TaxID=307124 RepID=UPI0012F663FF|nr:hypothetical protein [Calidithermus timidus]